MWRPCGYCWYSVKAQGQCKVSRSYMDRELSFDKHVNLVCRACNYHLWSLRHIQKYLTVVMANTIACSVVDSRLYYCNSILYITTKANITKLQRVQNSFARVVLDARRRSARAATLAASQLPYWLQDCAHHVQSVKIWSTSLSVDLLIHQHEVRATRSKGQCRLHQPVPNSQTSSRGFRYAAPSIWNLLPPDLRIKETVPVFKTGLKTYMFLFACMSFLKKLVLNHTSTYAWYICQLVVDIKLSICRPHCNVP